MDEQRAPAEITIEHPTKSELTGDALSAEIERLTLLREQEVRRQQEEEARNKPPRPIDEVMLEAFARVVDKLGHDEMLEALLQEARRALVK